jgi:N-methylhydantoinase B/oxoprolinase/acetone carboxylase alpha subunit
VLLVHSSGGGGWGDPARRSAAQHAADRLSGLVTDTTDHA